MITSVSLHYFKSFLKQDFDLSSHLVLAGHNNAGKTTLLQAIAVWNMALQKWVAERGPTSSSKAKLRTGVPITRSEFTAIPLREMKLLWHDTITGLTQSELPEGQKIGGPRPLLVRLSGNSLGVSWTVGFEFRYSSAEQIYVKPVAEDIDHIPTASQDVQVVYVPPFSGIGAQETRLDRPYQDMLIGQGKPGDILRNLLREIYEKSDKSDWNALQSEIQKIFGFNLLPPVYDNRPFILCEYQPGIPISGKQSLPKLDISNAGSGFHQALVLLAFLYSREATVLLLDEPDAHQHVVLQKQIYDRLRSIVESRRCQLILATHSEVIIDSTNPGNILSFYDHPHLLVSDFQRDQVREALKKITGMDILLSEPSAGVLYVEGETDFSLLKAWAGVLGHPLATAWFDKFPFWQNNNGRDVGEAKNHLFALQALKPNIKGFLLLDGDNRGQPDKELTKEGLTIGRWTRYEAESYLLHKDVLRRYVSNVNGEMFASTALTFMEDNMPPAVIRDPLGDHDYYRSTPASKTILPGILEAGDVKTFKNEYFLIAEQMLPGEIPVEVMQKLDEIGRLFGIM